LFVREEENADGSNGHGSSREERIRDQAKRVRDEANNLPLGKERDDLLKKARDADAAETINGWLISPGLQPPK
jgi:hypothetical protein